MSDCFLTGLCGQKKQNGVVHTALKQPVLAPFVIVKVTDGNSGPTAVAILREYVDTVLGIQTTISVGNKSRPAVVKSFHYGSANGAGCDIEIVDEEAGSFATIFEKLNRGGTSAGTFLSVRFGWIANDCDGSIVGPGPAPKEVNPLSQEAGLSSPELLFLIEKVTLSYSGGLVKYTINCIDMLQDLQQSAVKGVFGTDEKPMHLTDAISQLFQDRDLKVEFKKFTSPTTSVPFTFDSKNDPNPDVKTKGPIRKWEGKNRRVLECIMEWCRTVLCDDGKSGKGIKLFYEPTKPARLICMCDIPDHLQAVTSYAKYSIGTYVVGGGNCSPVIRFQPSIQWAGGQTAYSVGGTAGGAQAKIMVAKGPADGINDKQSQPQLYGKGTDNMSLGNILSIVMQEGEVATRINAAMRYSYNCTYMNNLANIVFGGGITAELTIQGNPNMSMPLFLLNRFVNVIVINPFTIKDNCRWSTGIETCNSVLSNESWMIEGVSHSIQPGSFTTTFKLRMLTPGQDLSVKAPDGGSK
jgi:hypothetical protein